MSIEHKKSDKLNTGLGGSKSTRRKLPLGILSVIIALISLLIAIAATLISSSILNASLLSFFENVGYLTSIISIVALVLFYIYKYNDISSDEGLEDEK